MSRKFAFSTLLVLVLAVGATAQEAPRGVPGNEIYRLMQVPEGAAVQRVPEPETSPDDSRRHAKKYAERESRPQRRIARIVQRYRPYRLVASGGGCKFGYVRGRQTGRIYLETCNRS
jgi:hypothetical protein